MKCRWKWPPQYRTSSTLSDFNDIPYMGRLWCPEFIPDIVKFLAVAIFKMALTIPHKFNIVRFQRHFIWHHYLPTYQILMISDNIEFLPPIFYAVFWQPFWKWQTSRKFWKRRIAPLMVTSFFPWHMNLSTADLGNYWTEFHETWWSYRYMFLVGPKVFTFMVNFRGGG
jgi:hypothetical protein